MIWRFWKLLLWVLFAGTLLGLLFGTQVYLIKDRVLGEDTTWLDDFLRMLPQWLLWAMLAPIVYWLSGRIRFERGSWMLPLLFHLPMSFGIGLLQIVLPVLFLRTSWDPVNLESIDFTSHLMSVVGARFHWNLLVYFGIVMLSHALHFYRDAREKELQASELESRLVRAQLQALRMQLHPHFLFNALNAISTLVHRDPEAADRMIAELAGLLRLALENPRTHELPLDRELEYLESYLSIEQVRFQDRMKVRYDVDPELRQALVPNLLLQPLVENAVKHGLSRMASAGRIEICARADGPQLELIIDDDGPGMPEGGVISEGVGLRNTRGRLDHLYGEEQELCFEESPLGGMRVRVRLPLHFTAADSTRGGGDSFLFFRSIEPGSSGSERGKEGRRRGP
jgi:two-component system LytT family sensor kinase